MTRRLALPATLGVVLGLCTCARSEDSVQYGVSYARGRSEAQRATGPYPLLAPHYYRAAKNPVSEAEYYHARGIADGWHDGTGIVRFPADRLALQRVDKPTVFPPPR